MIKDLECVILCGGQGKRLKKITGNTPKPMVYFGKRRFLDILIGYLHKQGIKKFILGVGYNADFIKKYYASKKIPGIELVFSKEYRPLGTGGALKQAKKFIRGNDFLVLNGDSFSVFNLNKLTDFYNKKKTLGLMLLKKIYNSADYGFVETDQNLKIVSYNEKDKQAGSGFINSGVYLFNKKIFSMMPKMDTFSLERDLFPAVIKKTPVYGYKGKGFFIDIGTPERYLQAKEYFQKRGLIK